MKRVFKWIRAIILSLILLAVGIPASLFIALSLPPIQRTIRTNVEDELSKVLDTNVRIRNLAISPFNRVTLFGVSVADANGIDAVTIERLGAGMSLVDLILFGEIVINYVEIIGLDGHLYKDTPEGKLNIDNIIAALKPKEQKESRAFKLSINSILLRGINFSYDVLSEPDGDANRFNRNHIKITNLRADISVPILSNNTYGADVYRLGLHEESGFTIDNLHGRFFLSPDSVTVSDLGIELPRSTLAFADLKLEFDKSSNIKDILSENVLTFSTKAPSYVTPADFACFFNPLEGLTSRFDLILNLEGSAREVNLNPLSIVSTQGSPMMLTIIGNGYNLLDNEGRSLNISDINVKASGQRVADLIPSASANLRHIIENIPEFTFEGKLDWNEKFMRTLGNLSSETGNITLSADCGYNGNEGNIFPLKYKAKVDIEGLDLLTLTGNNNLDVMSSVIESSGTITGPNALESSSTVNISRFGFKGYNYHDINIGCVTKGDELSLALTANNDPNIECDLKLLYSGLRKRLHTLELNCDIPVLNPMGLNLATTTRSLIFSGDMKANLEWSNIDDITGSVNIENCMLKDEGVSHSILKSLLLEVTGIPQDRHIELHSDHLNLKADGEIFISTLPKWGKFFASRLLPAIVEEEVLSPHLAQQNFAFTASVGETEWLSPYIKLPVSALHDITVAGHIDTYNGNIAVNVVAPYLRQGNKLLEQSGIELSVMNFYEAELYVSSRIPTKRGMMDFFVNNIIVPDNIDTSIKWIIDNSRQFMGDIGLNTTLSRGLSRLFAPSNLNARIDIKESILAFNDSVWTLEPCSIDVAGQSSISINDLMALRQGQTVKINGIISASPDEQVDVILDNVDLDYIFETLAINNVTIGGVATGDFTGAALLSGEPHLYTDGLRVKNISYNGAVIGDAFIRSGWDTEKRSIDINADITQSNECHTFIRGAIFPMNDSLDLTFLPEKVRIGFLKPYVEAFTSEISGYASGEARLWGNFHDIDLTARILAHDVNIRVDFTNVDYIANDSVIINPGVINLANLRVTDEYGHHARLNGTVRHKFFRQPEFEFNLSGADNLLVLDEPEGANPRWYGKVFANGGAAVKGGPGFVDITCDLETASGTTFTFVLNDLQDAGEYTFITYRDRDYLSIRDSLIKADTTPKLVKEFRSRQQRIVEDSKSRYDLDLNINVNPQAQMNLIMDPQAGDRIRSWGDGSIRLTYGSVDEELKIYGTYTLERGNYNFSLQDIIIKDFTIRQGSSITFRGDPYGAMLDITAVYNLTANLSDLDAMFLEDKDISRTNVPVHALLHVDGDLHQPDISFDLEFPTLTSDTYRKVRSIISTEDMMNRQMIYLLALNRFYTPDYMQSATKGNELISVASSTLSSQLSNILGQISDKWTIAPSIKSERSDFADMEVDLALSSSLLNNRLLLNGNFGYRDKMLNTNQFVGDFDVEYLLNRSGTLRLKAYNRYNDRNFYFKTAATTQGVGVMVKHDFDSFSNFLKLFQKKEKDKKEDKEMKAEDKD